MKDIKEYIIEAVGGEINFQSQKFQLNQLIKSNVNNDI